MRAAKEEPSEENFESLSSGGLPSAPALLSSAPGAPSVVVSSSASPGLVCSLCAGLLPAALLAQPPLYTTDAARLQHARAHAALSAETLPTIHLRCFARALPREPEEHQGPSPAPAPLPLVKPGSGRGSVAASPVPLPSPASSRAASPPTPSPIPASAASSLAHAAAPSPSPAPALVELEEDSSDDDDLAIVEDFGSPKLPLSGQDAVPKPLGGGTWTGYPDDAGAKPLQGETWAGQAEAGGRSLCRFIELLKTEHGVEERRLRCALCAYQVGVVERNSRQVQAHVLFHAPLCVFFCRLCKRPVRHRGSHMRRTHPMHIEAWDFKDFRFRHDVMLTNLLHKCFPDFAPQSLTPTQAPKSPPRDVKLEPTEEKPERLATPKKSSKRLAPKLSDTPSRKDSEWRERIAEGASEWARRVAGSQAHEAHSKSHPQSSGAEAEELDKDSKQPKPALSRRAANRRDSQSSEDSEGAEERSPSASRWKSSSPLLEPRLTVAQGTKRAMRKRRRELEAGQRSSACALCRHQPPTKQTVRHALGHLGGQCFRCGLCGAGLRRLDGHFARRHPGETPDFTDLRGRRDRGLPELFDRCFPKA